jgi:hemin uptake protein HemP
MNDIKPTPAQERHPEPQATDKGIENTPILSQTLLGERSWVTIEHLGTLYRLQTTRQGKLILTK